MKSLFLIGCLLAVGLQPAWGQGTCFDPNPPECGGVPFQALLIDAAFPAGRVVQRLCVGGTYRFEPCASRAVVTQTTQVLYTADPLLPPCLIRPVSVHERSVYRYTVPATAGASIVVTENASNGGAGTLYQRTFPVQATPSPAFTLRPCPNGNVRLLLPDPNYTVFAVEIGGNRRTLGGRDVVLNLAGATSFRLIGSQPGSFCEGQVTVNVPALVLPSRPVLNTLTLTGPLPGLATLAVSNLPTGYRYTLVRADASAPGGFAPVAKVPPGTASLPVPLPVSGCYRLRQSDFCDVDSLLSEAELCPLPLTGQTRPGQNLLAFSYPGAVRDFTLFRNGANLATLPTGTTAYPDNAVVCGTTYRYRLQANVLPASGAAVATSVSNDLELLATTGVVPPAPTLRASFNLRNVVELTAALPGGTAVPPGSALRYARSLSNGPTADFLTVPVAPGAALRPGRDSTALPALLAAPPCYTARLVDVCGQPSTSTPEVCPALLTARPETGSTDRINLSHTLLQSPGGPFAYTLLVLDADGRELRRQAVSNGTATDISPLTDPQRLRYRLEITGLGLTTPSYSNLADVPRPLRLAVPTAFTPNGDGLNDLLELKGRYLDRFTFVVVDRNGQEVFRATDRSTAWDGRINGRAPVNGTYVWRFSQTDGNGEIRAQTGTVTIVN